MSGLTSGHKNYKDLSWNNEAFAMRSGVVVSFEHPVYSNGYFLGKLGNVVCLLDQVLKVIMDQEAPELSYLGVISSHARTLWAVHTSV